jgi:glucosyl-3-phosphoglycerate phosphatase
MPADGHAAPHGSGADAVFDAARTTGLAPRVGLFLFCRHGQTAGNAGRIYQHPQDPLDAEGHAQAARAAALIASGPQVSRLLASDMARAWLTAGHVATRTGLAAKAVPGLRERSFGTLAGSSSAGFDWRIDPPGGESLAAFVQRSIVALSDALTGEEAPLLVAHGGTLLVLEGALGVALEPALRANAVPLLFRRAGTAWEVLRLGEA